jgi:NitT/TauT family transport system permease protein
VAFAAARWTIARDVLLPVAIGASAIPLVAAAPIMIGWFGLLNPLSMMMMAALISFFPIMINVTRGLVQVHPSAIELMRSYATTPGQVLRKVRVPNMLPFFFTALKVSTTLAFIGAIVGEYFGGASKVIGKVVMTGIANGSFDVAWAGIIIGACGAIVAYLLVSVAERLVIPWYAALRAGEI